MTTEATLALESGAATVSLVDETAKLTLADWRASLLHPESPADVVYERVGEMVRLVTDDGEQLLTDDDQPLFVFITGSAQVEVH